MKVTYISQKSFVRLIFSRETSSKKRCAPSQKFFMIKLCPGFLTQSLCLYTATKDILRGRKCSPLGIQHDIKSHRYQLWENFGGRVVPVAASQSRTALP